MLVLLVGRLHARCLRLVASHAGVPVGLESDLLSVASEFIGNVICTLFFKVVCRFFVPEIEWFALLRVNM